MGHSFLAFYWPREPQPQLPLLQTFPELSEFLCFSFRWGWTGERVGAVNGSCMASLPVKYYFHRDISDSTFHWVPSMAWIMVALSSSCQHLHWYWSTKEPREPSSEHIPHPMPQALQGFRSWLFYILNPCLSLPIVWEHSFSLDRENWARRMARNLWPTLNKLCRGDEPQIREDSLKPILELIICIVLWVGK